MDPQPPTLSIIAAAAAALLLHAAWYGPLLGKAWLLAQYGSGQAAERARRKAPMAPTLALAGIGYLAQSFVFARVLGAFQAVTPAQGIEAGFLVWVGFLLPVSVTLTALSKERQWTVLWIHTSFQLLCSMIMGVILVGLR